MFTDKIKIALYAAVFAYNMCSGMHNPVQVQLELFPGQEKQTMDLGFEYHSLSAQEQKNTTFVGEGNYTVLTAAGTSAVVGMLKPCQLLVLANNAKVVVAHLYYIANLRSLLDESKKEFAGADLSKTKAVLFTNHDVDYEKEDNFFGDKRVSWKYKYHDRTQIEELKRVGNTIIDYFEIKDKTQIIARKFNSKKKEADWGSYAFAELFTVVQYSSDKPLIYNICPMAENMWGNFEHLPLSNRIDAFLDALHNNHISTNRFIKDAILMLNVKYSMLSKEERNSFTQYPYYGIYPFVRV